MSNRIDAEAILRTLADVRKSIPYELTPVPPDGAFAPGPAYGADAMTDFELETVAEAVDRLTAELTGAIERAREHALAEALRVYYAAEELARDPANAHLIPHVEAMRRAYEHDFGVPILPKG